MYTYNNKLQQYIIRLNNIIQPNQTKQNKNTIRQNIAKQTYHNITFQNIT